MIPKTMTQTEEYISRAINNLRDASKTMTPNKRYINSAINNLRGASEDLKNPLKKEVENIIKEIKITSLKKEVDNIIKELRGVLAALYEKRNNKAA